MLYTVIQGDTLSRIAKKFGVPLNSLIALNSLADPNRLLIGQQLQVPNMQDIPSDATFVLPVHNSSLVQRARSVVNVDIAYKLGAGGMSPALVKPSSSGFCDCSGFICWVLGLSRQTKIPFYRHNFGGWINTDAMEGDILSTTGIFDRLTSPEPGCIVVYGAQLNIGHVGLVSEVDGDRMARVIHCSSGNSRVHNGRSIQETLPTVFDRPDIYWGRFVG
ncbi:LysM peptidoglycan-binding domain-containing protein [Pedobacter agri]|uniref:LysM peptidoglycan-binding domain-containing protein n=1 Tax=Pedobacter agri TaxID=454586 RepID=UPI002931AAAA|nr:LysM peptidoglycan-binding domain-containing protein [Pedobacter agri]